MVESIYFLKPAWCGTHLAGLWPEQGLQPVTRATALRRWISLFAWDFEILIFDRKIEVAGSHDEWLDCRFSGDESAYRAYFVEYIGLEPWSTPQSASAE